jgi:hypothetical protein
LLYLAMASDNNLFEFPVGLTRGHNSSTLCSMANVHPLLTTRQL